MDKASLVERLRSGDSAALERIVSLNGDRLFRSAVLLCGSEQVAEDLVQETFLRAFRSAGKFRGDSTISTWLHGILLNVNRKRFRRERRLVYTDTLPEQPSEMPDPSSGSSDAEKVTVLVWDALSKLSLKHREVIVLHYYEEMPIEEIARQTRSRKGTVKSRLHYAREQLRGLLPEELNLFG